MHFPTTRQESIFPFLLEWTFEKEIVKVEKPETKNLVKWVWIMLIDVKNE